MSMPRDNPLAARDRSGARPRPRVARPTLAGATIHESRLRNGLRLLVVERPTDPVVSVMTWYRVGACHEREHEAGCSHFLEHMMFKGSAGFGKGEVDRVTTLLGGVNNASTRYDNTSYWFEFASDRWEVALEIEADRMRRLTLDPTEFELERAVVLEELAMGRDNPWQNLAHRVQAALFERHPYRRPIIGYADVLEALDVADMRAFYERFYHPGNATLVVCGDVRPAKVQRLVRRHFGALEAGAPFEEIDPPRAQVEEPVGETRVEMTWDDQGRRVCMAWPTVPFGTAADDELDLVSAVLTGGRASRLHRRLVIEQGLATDVSTENDTRVEGGLFWTFVEAAQGTDLERLERAFDEELAKLGAEGPTAAEMKRARAMLVASESYDTETVSDLAEEIGEHAMDGDWRAITTWNERIKKVTARRVRAAVQRFLRPERRVVGRSLPRSNGSIGVAARLDGARA